MAKQIYLLALMVETLPDATVAATVTKKADKVNTFIFLDKALLETGVLL